METMRCFHSCCWKHPSSGRLCLCAVVRPDRANGLQQCTCVDSLADSLASISNSFLSSSAGVHFPNGLAASCRFGLSVIAPMFTAVIERSPTWKVKFAFISHTSFTHLSVLPESYSTYYR